MTDLGIILPCPFCGESNFIIEIKSSCGGQGDFGEEKSLHCASCGVIVTHDGYYNSFDPARWNERKISGSVRYALFRDGDIIISKDSPEKLEQAIDMMYFDKLGMVPKGIKWTKEEMLQKYSKYKLTFEEIK
jgi:hypothetical protein